MPDILIYYLVGSSLTYPKIQYMAESLLTIHMCPLNIPFQIKYLPLLHLWGQSLTLGKKTLGAVTLANLPGPHFVQSGRHAGTYLGLLVQGKM